MKNTTFLTVNVVPTMFQEKKRFNYYIILMGISEHKK